MTRCAILPALALLLPLAASAEVGAGFADPRETRAALARAQADARAAAGRAERLETAASAAQRAADRSAREAAALAARIQQSEAGIAAATARIGLARQQRAELDRRLADRREPLIRLTAGLQKLARRPLALSVLRPGSLRETVYLRALLEATVPEVQRRTAALRGEIARASAIESEARRAVIALRESEATLSQRRNRLAALESRQRLASRQASGAAAREAEAALALAEEARDLDQLVGRIDGAAQLRRTLAALPGPMLRPADTGRAGIAVDPVGPPPAPDANGRAPGFQLPVTGRTVAGFGQIGEDGVRSNGLALAPLDGAQVVAPAAGRIAFAGPFRGFDRIVIIEHDGGFTSLVTGLARIDAGVGESVLGGAPLGVAGVGRPVVSFELRRNAAPVNPLDWMR